MPDMPEVQRTQLVRVWLDTSEERGWVVDMDVNACRVATIKKFPPTQEGKEAAIGFAYLKARRIGYELKVQQDPLHFGGSCSLAGGWPPLTIYRDDDGRYFEMKSTSDFQAAVKTEISEADAAALISEWESLAS